MATKEAVPGIQPVRPLDPAWRVKFKSLKELSDVKRLCRTSANSAASLRKHSKGNSKY
jgi:hypothetical protein